MLSILFSWALKGGADGDARKLVDNLWGLESLNQRAILASEVGQAGFLRGNFMSEITIQKAEQGAVSVLVVSGKLDAKTAPQLNAEIKGLLAAGKNKIVVDMKGVSYIASAGVGTLKAGLIEAKKGGGDLRLATLAPEVKDVFDVLGFSKLFTIKSNLNEAMAGL